MIEEVKIQAKVCTKCGIEKPITEFYKEKNGKYGVKKTCKVCYKLITKKYREENSEYYKKYSKKYREENSEYTKEYAKKYREENSEYFKKYYQENIEYKKEYQKKHYQENSELYKLKVKKRRAKKKQALGNLSSEDIKKLNSYTNCYYCGCQLNDDKDMNDNKRHHDHFIPISRNGTEYIENYKAVCQSCNLSKNNKLPHVWLKEQGLLEEYDRKSTEKYLRISEKDNNT